MTKLTHRQQLILDYVIQRVSAQTREVASFLADKVEHSSRASIIRDLNFLAANKLLTVSGKGRGARYEPAEKRGILHYIDVQEYFSRPVDERTAKETFNFEIFKDLRGDIFSTQELQEFERLNNDYRSRIKLLSPTALKKEFERITIEFSWKSSRLEGNTYSLIDTEILLKENREATGHTKEEAVMILNHKKALEYTRDTRSNFRELDLRKIENVQSIIIDGLDIERGIRKRPVGVVGAKYKPLGNQFQIQEALEEGCGLINATKNVPTKALLAILLISYIQPFEDGNKRTSRLLGNALLLAYDYPPLSFRSVDEAEYKKALILFYEQNNLLYFKELFVEQFNFAAQNYFL